jgi:dihydroflavonol-4-reductase
MKKVLVTGISGFVGQHCAAELLKNGYAVRGSLRSLSKSDEVKNGIKRIEICIKHSNQVDSLHSSSLK